MKQIYKPKNESSWEILELDGVKLEDLRVDHIGIHAAPGAQFKINGNGNFFIGGTGIFEINLEGKNTYIHSIKCIRNNNHFVLIDISGKGVTL